MSASRKNLINQDDASRTRARLVGAPARASREMLVAALGWVVRPVLPVPARAPGLRPHGLTRPISACMSSGAALPGAELPAYRMSVYIEDTDAFAVTCARLPLEPSA